MRVFLSLPMSGRTDNEIKSEIAHMKTVFLLNNDISSGTQIEFVHNFEEMEVVTNTYDPFSGEERKTPALYYLGRAIGKMAYCDAVLFSEDYYKARGCMAECYVALRYDLPMYFIEEADDGEAVICKRHGIEVVDEAGRLYDELYFDLEE